MFDNPIAALIQGGAVAALVFTTYGFLSGKVVPRIWYDAQAKFYEQALAQEREQRQKAEARAEWWQSHSEKVEALAERGLDATQTALQRRP